MVLQLEFNLSDQIRETESDPTAIDFRQLCLCFDAELERMRAKDKLEQGAEAIQQLAELLVMRADAYFYEFQQRYDPVGPSLATDDFTDLFRQTFSLEINDFNLEPEPTYRLPSEHDNFNNSVGAIRSRRNDGTSNSSNGQ